MNKKIVIAGATGFVGKYIVTKFQNEGYEVLIISRQNHHISWTDQTGIIAALENSEMLINLAGKSVDCRYNEKNKKEIYDSRINTTQKLGEAILKCQQPPALWINASTATIYRHAEDRPMTEKDGEIGHGFSVNVATNWERAFFDFHLKNTRQVALRMAIILGKNGGVIQPFKNLVKFGLGGIQGNGNQMFSWIHIEDVYQIILFIRDNKNLSGVFNTSAPNPVTNKTLMSSCRRVLHKRFGLPSPKWVLKIGAMLIKTETELILKSRWVIPERLQNEGYIFKYDEIDDALNNILNT